MLPPRDPLISRLQDPLDTLLPLLCHVPSAPASLSSQCNSWFRVMFMFTRISSVLLWKCNFPENKDYRNNLGDTYEKRKGGKQHTWYSILPILFGQVQLIKELEIWKVIGFLWLYRATFSPLSTHLNLLKINILLVNPHLVNSYSTVRTYLCCHHNSDILPSPHCTSYKPTPQLHPTPSFHSSLSILPSLSDPIVFSFISVKIYDKINILMIYNNYCFFSSQVGGTWKVFIVIVPGIQQSLKKKKKRLLNEQKSERMNAKLTQRLSILSVDYG